jgi:hypothetical protein
MWLWLKEVELNIFQVKNTIVFDESKICREYWVNVKAYLNMVQKNPKILYEFICQIIEF